MSNRQRAEVRFVKCPKCANILQEPEHCPLYACGGCETILLAKYYSGDRKATKSDSLEQSTFRSNSEGHASDDGESISSSRRSSSPGEDLTDRNGCKNKNDADESRKQEQIGAPDPTHEYNASLSDESAFLHNRGNGFIENETNLDRSDYEVNQNREQLEASSEGVSMTVFENKNSEQLAAANPVLEDKSSDGNQNLKQIGVVESARDASAQNESEVIENKEPSRYAEGPTFSEDTESQDSVSNEATENEDARHKLSRKAGFDYQKQVREVGYAEEAAVFNDTTVSENKERLELALEKGTVHEESDSNPLGETRKEKLKGADSHGNVLVDEIHYLETERLPGIVMFAKEDNKGENQNELVECTKEQHESMNQSEVASSVEIAQGVNESRMEEIKSNLGGCSNVSASTQRLTGMGTTKDTDSVDVFQEHQSERSSVNIHSESSKRSENEDDFAEPQHVIYAIGPEISQPVDTQGEVTNSLEVVPGSLTKGALAYDGSISSFDGNDEQALEQHENIPEDSLLGNGAVAGHVGAEESPEWTNEPSSRINRNSRIQSRTKNSSQVLLNGKLKSMMFKEEESVGENVIPERNRTRRNRDKFPARGPFYQSSEVAYETGSSSSYIHDELPPRMHRHPYRYEDPEPWVRNMYIQKENNDRRSLDAYRRDNEFLSMYYGYDTSGEFYHRSRYHNHIDRRWRRESWHQNGRYQMWNPYMHRHPDNDYWWSAQVAPPFAGVHSRQGPYASPPREVEWDPYESSPPQFMEYEHYPWARDPISFSDDQRRKGQTMRRLYSKEKRQTVRRYFQPMAGGAPFVTCNFCFNVLQLPEDFLVSRSSKSRTHRLRCGDCSKILEFTLDNTSTLAPCKPNTNADSGTNPIRNTDAHNHLNHFRGSSSVPEESRDSEKIKVGPNNSGGIEREHWSDNAAGSSSQTKEMKVTWKLPNRKSPLHRLMGYSSPKVLLDVHQNEEAE